MVFIIDCLVPHGYAEDPSFAEWIHRQRTTHAHMLKEEKPSPLVVARMKQLSDLGTIDDLNARWTVLLRKHSFDSNCLLSFDTFLY